MRAKPSSTASGMYRRHGSHTPQIPICALSSTPPGGGIRSESDGRGLHGESFAHPDLLKSQADLEDTQDAGMLHDARNLMGAIGLYCDLLSMPGVLNPEHRHYAEELRLLGSRSGALIQRLMEQHLESAPLQIGLKRAGERSWQEKALRSLQLEKVRRATANPMSGGVSLRAIIERCSGLLSRVAGGRQIEVSYGVAAAAPVPVDEEAVERILVNLVRNSAAAMRQRGEPPLDEAIDDEAVDGDTPGEVVLRTEDATGDDTPGAIRIGVGHLINRVEDPKPWPLRRVRLTVEDSGCGMTQEQLDRIVCGDRAPSRGSHGIGFRVVRELVGASNGDLRVMSAPSVGTRVQIEWPVTKIADEFVLQTGAETSCMEDSSRLAAASFRPERERRAANDSKSTHRTKMNAIPVSQMDSAVGVDRGMAC